MYNWFQFLVYFWLLILAQNTSCDKKGVLFIKKLFLKDNKVIQLEVQNFVQKTYLPKKVILEVETLVGFFRLRFKSKVYMCSGNDYSFNKSQVFLNFCQSIV